MNFHKVFWDKTSADNFWTFVYTGPTVLRHLSVNPNHQKTWHVQPTFTTFKCSNWILSFPRLGRIFQRWAKFYWAEKQVEDRWGWIFKVHKFWLPRKSDLNVPLIGWRVGIAGEICDQFKLHGESDCPPSQHTYVGNTTPETADLLVDTHYLCSYQSLAIKWPYLRFSLIQLAIRGRAC